MDPMGNSMRGVQPSSWVRVFVLTPESNRLSPVYRFLRFQFHESRFCFRLRVDGAIFVQFWTREDVAMLHDHAWISDWEIIAFYGVSFADLENMPLLGCGFVQVA
jgi:hypothetical protein